MTTRWRTFHPKGPTVDAEVKRVKAALDRQAAWLWLNTNWLRAADQGCESDFERLLEAFESFKKGLDETAKICKEEM